MAGARLEHRLYFFDMKAVMSSEHRLKDAIFSVGTKADGTPLHNRDINFTDPLVQYEQGVFPANAIFKFDAYERPYSNFWDNADIRNLPDPHRQKTSKALTAPTFPVCRQPPKT